MSSLYLNNYPVRKRRHEFHWWRKVTEGPRHHLGRGKAMMRKPERLSLYLKDSISPARLLELEETKILLVATEYYLAIKNVNPEKENAK